MDSDKLREKLSVVLEQMARNSAVTDSLVDKNRYRLYLCTLWSNLVLEPDQLDLEANDLEQAFEVINDLAHDVLGERDAIRTSFQFVASSAGEHEMNQAKISRNHRDLLAYFSSMILDPEGHKQWLSQVRSENPWLRR